MPHIIESGFFLYYLALAAAMLVVVGRIWDLGGERFLNLLHRQVGDLSRRAGWIGYLSFAGVLNMLVIGFSASDIRVEEEMVAAGAGARSVSVTICCGLEFVLKGTAPQDSVLRSREGQSYKYSVKLPRIFSAGQDSLGNTEGSGTVVLEDDKPLGVPHALHADIQRTGLGRYSHWGAYGSNESLLLLSSTDHSSPLENARTYTVGYEVFLAPWCVLFVFVLSAPAYLMALRAGAGRWAAMRRTFPQASTAGAWVLGLGVVALFLLPLVGGWMDGRTSYLAIAGLLPWSDASGWLHGTNHLLNEGEFFWWTVRRPLNPVVLSFLAFLSGYDLQGMLVLRALMVGTACFVFVREVWDVFGWIPAALALGVLAGFSYQFIGLTMSEATGLAFGSAGIALAWRGARQQRVAFYAGGLMLLGLGLSIRPGPMLVLPALMLWPLWGIQRSALRRGLWVGLSAAGVMGGLMVSWAWVAFFYKGANAPGSNAAYTLYGLAKGGQSWKAWFDDFPELRLESEGVQASIALREAVDLVLQSPSDLLTGLTVFAGNYIKYMFVYAGGGWAIVALKVLLVAGLVACVIWFRRGGLSFLFTAYAGVAASAPIIFWDYDAYRAFIVTAPVDAALVAAGASVVLHLIRGLAGTFGESPSVRGAGAGRGEQWVMGFGIMLLLSCSVFPLLSIASYERQTVDGGKCGEGYSSAVLDVGRTSPYVQVVKDGYSGGTWAPVVQESDFKRDASFANNELSDVFQSLKPGSFLIHGYDIQRDLPVAGEGQDPWPRLRWMVVPPEVRGVEEGLYFFCGVDRDITHGAGSSRVEFAVTFAAEAKRFPDATK
jgi:hypothetical protein